MRVWYLGDVLGAPNRAFTTDTDAEWVMDQTVGHDDATCLRSGTLTNSALYGTYVTSKLSTIVSGKGTVRFWWKASCENDPEWDHGEFVAGGETRCIYGETDWQEVTYTFTMEGDHMIMWTFLKDDFGTEGEDCIWVDQFHWTPESTVTTDVPVPGVWLDQYYPGTLDYEAVAKRKASNPAYTVEDCYLAGLVPTNSVNAFIATVTVTNSMVFINWTPNLNQGETNRIYKVYGCTDLVTDEWESPAQPWHHFFKVVVTMPTGMIGEETAVAGEGFLPADKPLIGGK